MKVQVLVVLLALMLGACAQREKRVESYLERDHSKYIPKRCGYSAIGSIYEKRNAFH